METVSLKLDEKTARQIERKVKESNYGTKTELIREAIRDKLKQLEEEKAKQGAWQALFAARGALKGKGKFKTDDEFYEWRKKYGEELAEKLAKKYGWRD